MSVSKFATAAAMVLFGGSACLMSGASHAQQSMPASSDASSLPSFEQLDTAHHGYLTRSDVPKDVEGLKNLRMHFADADSNGNGRIEKSEYAAYVARTQPGQSAGGGSDSSSQPMQHLSGLNLRRSAEDRRKPSRRPRSNGKLLIARADQRQACCAQLQ
jgi:hypothetical protein